MNACFLCSQGQHGGWCYCPGVHVASGRHCNLASQSGCCMVERYGLWNWFQLLIRIYTRMSHSPQIQQVSLVLLLIF